MLSRRLIRIKTLHVLYAYFTSSDPSINKFEKELLFSFDKTFDLYYALLLLIIEVKKYALKKIDIAKNKRVPTEIDLNPNLRFVQNKLIEQIEDNISFKNYLNKKKISWVNYPELTKQIYQKMVNSDGYKNYMDNPDHSYSADKKFAIEFFINHLDSSELLYQVLEEQSIYWNDDVEFIINMIIKTLKGFNEKNGNRARLMPLFKNEDDKIFAKKLFRKTVVNSKEYLELIEKHTKNWEVERIAFIDIIFMQMAIAEVIEFESIPIKVTLNEYIEIIKFYSTAKSSTFINGILDNIITSLKKNGKIVKSGRGLVSN
ncbi:MAG: transcription antitermination factor NusB [Chlorobi bacterium]|nr:transcription antitermination factor NusB [Chlorobiota bacterium]